MKDNIKISLEIRTASAFHGPLDGRPAGSPIIFTIANSNQGESTFLYTMSHFVSTTYSETYVVWSSNFTENDKQIQPKGRMILSHSKLWFPEFNQRNYYLKRFKSWNHVSAVMTWTFPQRKEMNEYHTRWKRIRGPSRAVGNRLNKKSPIKVKKQKKKRRKVERPTVSFSQSAWCLLPSDDCSVATTIIPSSTEKMPNDTRRGNRISIPTQNHSKTIERNDNKKPSVREINVLVSLRILYTPWNNSAVVRRPIPFSAL